ncbi:MAG: PSD1 and planctomycete cytochrome C domain-containing protein [Bryobacteraceae bacterium]|nr:PSD1 and planctomycete cytochrome C domain-containing protein [Bryobacteraceae bacterium]
MALASQTPEQLFSETLLPVLERDCQGCHGGTQALSKLDLRTRESLLAGGARGPAIAPGKSESSLLVHAIEGRNKLQMPPGGESKKLSPELIAAFRIWIDAGAPWPSKNVARKWDYKPEDLWAFQPLRPFEKDRHIDDFILEKLQQRRLSASAQADRRTLIRRVTIDLTGLPPKPEEVRAFLADTSATAWEKVVDRLLASPRYGEHWGRHWLDVTRYADTNGYSNDFERPNAWRYRDYVIRSFNADKPYDRFILEQIAGDELFPGDPEALIATGFLRSGPWEHTAMSVEAVTRQLFLDDVTHNTTATFLGLTLGCARCHDHKFDPIPTRDYYRMQAVFASTEFARPKVPFLSSENTSDVAGDATRMVELQRRTEERIRDYRQRAVTQLMKARGISRIEDVPKAELNQAMNTGAGLDPATFEEYKLFQKHSQLYKESLDRFEAKAFAVSSGPVDGSTDGGNVLRYPNRAAYKPAAVHILPGGNIQSPADRVTPGLLSAPATTGKFPAPEVPDSVEGRRTVLAKWIADPGNPLTARVMVNRIWQYHFGRGIAADTSNFGKMGHKPSHPELLDHLAQSFIANGWSVKQLHRTILLSNTYRRGSTQADMKSLSATDPENQLLAYFSPRRVEAETLRDSILAVSGELSLESGGPGVFPQINEDVARQPQHRMGSLAPAYHASPLKRQRNRRTIYTFQQRSLIDPVIDVFNGPGLDLSCERRDASTVPTQAFALFNSAFSHDMALAFAARLATSSRDIDTQINQAFELAYGRAPSKEELDASRQHVQRLTAVHEKTPPPERPSKKPLIHKITSELTGESFQFTQQEDTVPYEENLHPSQVSPAVRALADFTLAILNSNEFVYVY